MTQPHAERNAVHALLLAALLALSIFPSSLFTRHMPPHSAR
jgi:hypothetical protein